MTTAAQIAASAFTAVAASITDVIHSATLTYQTKEARGYDHKSGKFFAQATTLSGRALFDTVKPAADIFPDYTRSPKDELVLLEGFAEAAQEGWLLAVGGNTYTVSRAQAVVGIPALCYAIARRVPG
jgi:hypothetical protein